MAGAKLQTKLPIIEHMVSIADYILIGGLLAFTFHAAAKQYGLPLNQQANPTYPELYDSHIETDFLDRAAELLRQYPQKIVLPIDFQVGNLFDKQEILDVGPQTIALFQRRLAMAKTIFWNGTLGYYEHPDYAHGTLQLAKTTSQLSSYKVIGGGDTHNALPPDILDTFNFVSMGGGATLEYLAKHSPE
jgi:phosphoglycerate kinase